MANVEGAARFSGFAAFQGEKENSRNHGKRNEIGPDVVKSICFELGGPQTVSVLQGLTTKLDEARGGELNVATASES